MSKPHRAHTIDEDENDGTRVRRRQRLDEARFADPYDEFDERVMQIMADEFGAPSEKTERDQKASFVAWRAWIDEFGAPSEKTENDEQEAPSQNTILGSDYLPLGNGCYIRRSHPPAE